MALCIQMRVLGYTVAPRTRSSHTAGLPTKHLCDPIHYQTGAFMRIHGERFALVSIPEKP